MQYRARVVDGNQRIATVTVEAVGENEARQALGHQGVRVVSLTAASAASGPGASSTGAIALSLFCQELLALLRAGLSVIEAVDALLEKSPSPHECMVFDRLARDLRAGHPLSVALQHQPNQFPPLFVALVGGAERTSNLAQALERFIEYRSRIDAVRAKVLSASVYPAILLAVGGVVALFLLTYVVPKFAMVYQGTGRALPWASQLLIDWGRFAAGHARPLTLGALVAMGLIVQSLLGARRSGALGAMVMQLPWVGGRLRAMEIARLYLTLGLLLEGGMSMSQALALMGTQGTPAAHARIHRLRATITEGLPFSEALARENLTLPVAARLLRVGEQTGQLGVMLRRAALFHEDETTRWIERLTRAFEPALMAVIGVVIGLIVLLLYMPIFDLAGSFQ